jgi:hypothetical protein
MRIIVALPLTGSPNAPDWPTYSDFKCSITDSCSTVFVFIYILKIFSPLFMKLSLKFADITILQAIFFINLLLFRKICNIVQNSTKIIETLSRKLKCADDQQLLRSKLIEILLYLKGNPLKD